VLFGVMTAGITVAALSLLFTGRYPCGLYDMLVGVARWSLRVTAYLALLTPRYPPFRLDQGESEPDGNPAGPSDAAPVPAANPARGGSIAGPASALVAGILLLLPAAGLGVAGGALIAFSTARDSAGYVTSSVLATSSSTAAVTAEGITIQGGDLWTRNLADVGGVRITAHGTAGKPVFVGIAPSSAVDGWLAGVAHDRITGISPTGAVYARTAGFPRRVPAPAAQDFWLASATDPGTATLQWQASNGDFTVVLANADGSAGFAAEVQASAQIPNLTPLGGGLLTTGIALGLLAIGLIVIGGVGLGRRHTGPPQAELPPGPPPAGPPPEFAAPAPPVTASR
jgi:hypothetical protein